MPDDDFRRWPTPESTGIDKGYEKARTTATAELHNQMAGPRDTAVPADDTGIKNPDGELENPAPFVGAVSKQPGGGPNGAGNSSGNGTIDPQGQQGGTEGGQPARPALPNEIHPVADAADRAVLDRAGTCDQ